MNMKFQERKKRLLFMLRKPRIPDAETGFQFKTQKLFRITLRSVQVSEDKASHQFRSHFIFPFFSPFNAIIIFMYLLRRTCGVARGEGGIVRADFACVN